MGNPVAPEEVWPVDRQVVRGNQNGLFAKVQYAVYRLAMGFFTRMPKSALNGFGRIFGMLGKRLDHKHAGAARGYLRQALNGHAGMELSDRAIERRVNVAYEHLFRVAVDAGRFDRRHGADCSPERLLEFVDADVTPEAREAIGKGCIVVSGHIGDWEMCARIASAVGFRPLYAISKPPSNYPLSVEFQRLRESWGMRLLPTEDGDALETRIHAFCTDVLEPPLKAVADHAGVVTEKLVDTPGLAPDHGSAAETLVRHLTGLNQSAVVSFGTEAGSFQRAGMPAVIFGPGSIDQAHKADEFITLDQVEQCVAFMGDLIAWAKTGE